jgi:hypothetical protein
MFVNESDLNEQKKKPPQTILVSDRLISKNISPLKSLDQMNRTLVGSIYGRSSIKIAHFVPKIFKKLVNQKQELPLAAMFVNGSEQNEQSL